VSGSSPFPVRRWAASSPLGFELVPVNDIQAMSLRLALIRFGVLLVHLFALKGGRRERLLAPGNASVQNALSLMDKTLRLQPCCCVARAYDSRTSGRSKPKNPDIVAPENMCNKLLHNLLFRPRCCEGTHVPQLACGEASNLTKALLDDRRQCGCYVEKADSVRDCLRPADRPRLCRCPIGNQWRHFARLKLNASLMTSQILKPAAR